MNRQQQIDQFSLALHRQAFAVLRLAPHRLDQVRTTLARWRALPVQTRSDGLWDEWARLLDTDFLAMERSALAQTDEATQLRSVSPFGVLIDQATRRDLLVQAREASKT